MVKINYNKTNTKSNKAQTNNAQTNNVQINNCQHVQLGGQAYYDESNYFLFSPDEPTPDIVQRMRRMHGVAQQMTDGTFDFVAQPRQKSQSKLIRKLAHGRVSKTKDGAIQLTLKIFADEQINVAEAIMKESEEAARAISPTHGPLQSPTPLPLPRREGSSMNRLIIARNRPYPLAPPPVGRGVV